MSLTLYMHPLSSYCWKALTALYETAAPFTARSVDLQDAAEREALCALWPFGKFPVLRDDARDRTVAESTSIIEYLAAYYPGASRLIPTGVDAALEVRHLDRVIDLHLHDRMQKLVDDIIRPADRKDPLGVQRARTHIATTYDLLERALADRTWLAGDTFTLADCAAAPALYYGNRVQPLGDAHPALARYLERLHARPSFARVFAEAQPFLAMFPG